MKLATLRDGTRDGRLVVVSKDLTRCSDAQHIAPTMQAALDDWERLAPALEVLARDVEHEAVRSEEHTSELQSLMRISYAVICLKKKKKNIKKHQTVRQYLNTTNQDQIRTRIH